MTELIQVCNTNQYVSAYKVVWMDFYNRSNFLTTILKKKLVVINKYQLFESCLKYEGTIDYQLSVLTNSVTYGDDLLKPNMTVQAQCVALLLLPKKLHKKRI